MIKENLQSIHERMENACKRAGRDISEVTLICVSKMHTYEEVLEAVEAGEITFGENRVQECLPKKEAVDEHSEVSTHWHLIGHLQSNKVKQIVGKVDMIHSVDSPELAEKINACAEKCGIVQDILLEVNIGDEDSKFGYDKANIMADLKRIGQLKNIKCKGLMCVAPICEDPEENRSYFKSMRDLSVDIKRENIDNIDMCELSMGMTGDFEVAIEEGATMVRIGTAIFGKRNYT